MTKRMTKDDYKQTLESQNRLLESVISDWKKLKNECQDDHYICVESKRDLNYLIDGFLIFNFIVFVIFLILGLINSIFFYLSAYFLMQMIFTFVFSYLYSVPKLEYKRVK